MMTPTHDEPNAPPHEPQAELTPPASVEIVERDSEPAPEPPFTPPRENILKQIVLFQIRFARYMFRVARSRDVRFSWKLRSFLALVYVISPLDLMPEAGLGPLGLFDDLGMILVVFDSLINRMPQELFDRFWIGGRAVISKMGAFIGGSFNLLPGMVRKGLHAALGDPGKASPPRLDE